MRIMTLLQNASSGTILFDDYDILRDRKAIRSILGYLPQDFRFEKLKTWEFLDYGAGLAGIKGARKRAEIVDEMLRKVGLYEVRDRWQPFVRRYETPFGNCTGHHRKSQSHHS